MYLTHVALGPGCPRSDCAWVASSFERGRAETTGTQCEAADLWTRIWDRADDLGGDVTVVKVKGHARRCRDSAVERGLIKRRGNHCADLGARQGAALHPADSAAVERVKRTFHP
eukprot:5037082-Pyramimonas_sp.AAC.1